MSVKELFSLFFTHKDYLPSAQELPGTLFTPLHLLIAALWASAVAVTVWKVSKSGEKNIRRFFTVLWILLIVLEPTKILWESLTGERIGIEWSGILPLYPCSIFMYAMPFAIWGSKWVRYAACGYCCTLGLLGGAINFVYPANVLNNYSAISFAGFHTLFYHSAILCCALIMLRSGYHSYTKATKLWHLLLPMAPCLVMSIPANIINFSPVGSDYMFFRLNSFFFAPLGAALPPIVCVILVYGIYLIIHAGPYLYGFIRNNKNAKETAMV